MAAKIKKRILIAEDEKVLADILSSKLTKEGFNVSVAGNGEDALKLIMKNKFDLLVLDRIMPKMDGFTVLASLRAEKIKQKVIVTSNLNQAEYNEKAKALGAKEVIVKAEMSLDEIVEKIKKQLK
jgi:DNA-binding response OmpR family regulator